MKIQIAVMVAILQMATVASQGIQVSVKTHVFDDLKDNYIPYLFKDIQTSVKINDGVLGKDWMTMNLTNAKLYLINCDQEKFAEDFKIIPPDSGKSNFVISAKNIDIFLFSNFKSKLIFINDWFDQWVNPIPYVEKMLHMDPKSLSQPHGYVDALFSGIDVDIDLELNPTQRD